MIRDHLTSREQRKDVPPWTGRKLESHAETKQSRGVRLVKVVMHILASMLSV
jgi:hypothetical protein